MISVLSMTWLMTVTFD